MAILTGIFGFLEVNVGLEEAPSLSIGVQLASVKRPGRSDSSSSHDLLSDPHKCQILPY